MPFDYRPGIAAIQQGRPAGRPQGPPPELTPEARRMRDWAHTQQARTQQAEMVGQFGPMVQQTSDSMPVPGSPQSGGAPSPGMFQPGPSDGSPGVVKPGMMPTGGKPGMMPTGGKPGIMPTGGKPGPKLPKLPGGLSPFDNRGPRGI